METQRLAVTEVNKRASCQGHQDCIYAVAAFPESRHFCTAGADGMVVQWDLDNPETGEMVAKVSSTVYALCPVPDSGLLIVGQNFDGIHLIDPVARKELRSLKLTNAAIFDLKLWGELLFVACGDGSLVVVNIREWRTVQRAVISEKSLRSIAINPVTRELALGCSDHTVRVLGLDGLHSKQVIDCHTNSVFALTYSPDMSMLYSAGRDAHMRTFTVADGYALKDDIIPHMYTVNQILFSPNGKVFATCSKDKSIRIWDAINLRPLKTIDRSSHAGHGTSVNRLLWMDDSTLVSVSDDRMASIWDIAFSS
jgi:WD repeat-containing protein 61